MTAQASPASRKDPVHLGKVIMILLAQSSQALSFGAISLFLPTIRADLGISFAQAGLLAGVATVCYAAMQIPAGLLADRFGPKGLFIGGLAAVNLLSISFTFLHDLHAVLINQALSGMFRALVFAPGLMLMSAQYSDSYQSLGNDVYVAGGFSSSILLNLAGPMLVGMLGWRYLIVAFAMFGLATVLAVAVTTREPGRARFGRKLADILRLLRTAPIWRAGAVQFVRLSVVNALFFWLPTLLTSDKGATIREAGLIVAISAAVTAPSNIIGGYLADRIARADRLIVLSLLVMTVTISGLVFTRGPISAAVLIGINAIFVQLCFGPLFALPIRVYGRENAGLISGFGNLCANLGAFTFDIALGVVKNRTGSFAGGLYALIVLCLFGAFAAHRLGRSAIASRRV